MQFSSRRAVDVMSSRRPRRYNYLSYSRLSAPASGQVACWRCVHATNLICSVGNTRPVPPRPWSRRPVARHGPYTAASRATRRPYCITVMPGTGRGPARGQHGYSGCRGCSLAPYVTCLNRRRLCSSSSRLLARHSAPRRYVTVGHCSPPGHLTPNDSQNSGNADICLAVVFSFILALSDAT